MQKLTNNFNVECRLSNNCITSADDNAHGNDRFRFLFRLISGFFQWTSQHRYLTPDRIVSMISLTGRSWRLMKTSKNIDDYEKLSFFFQRVHFCSSAFFLNCKQAIEYRNVIKNYWNWIRICCSFFSQTPVDTQHYYFYWYTYTREANFITRLETMKKFSRSRDLNEKIYMTQWLICNLFTQQTKLLLLLEYCTNMNMKPVEMEI